MKTTPHETFDEIKLRLTRHNADFVVNPNDPADLQKIADIRSELRNQNKKIPYEIKSGRCGHPPRFKERLVTRCIVEWRLPKEIDQTKLTQSDGKYGTNSPHWKQKDAVLGLVYIRDGVRDTRFF